MNLSMEELNKLRQLLIPQEPLRNVFLDYLESYPDRPLPCACCLSYPNLRSDSISCRNSQCRIYQQKDFSFRSFDRKELINLWNKSMLAFKPSYPTPNIQHSKHTRHMELLDVCTQRRGAVWAISQTIERHKDDLDIEELRQACHAFLQALDKVIYEQNGGDRGKNS